MLQRSRVPFLLLAAAWMLAGCTGPSSPPGAQGAAGVATVAAPPAAVSIALPGDQASTPRYKIAISYPALEPDAAVLAQALHAHAAAAKREFMQALPDARELPEFAKRQLQLIIDYALTSRSPAFINVRGKGMMDTGGAHPIPLDATFVFDRHAQRVLALDDLFVDPQAARAKLAAFARSALDARLLAKAPGPAEASSQARQEWLENMRDMIDAGTAPDAQHFAEFQIDPRSLLLVFPPYQVAPYVYGAQTVLVPFKVFAGALKPGYREAFSSSR